MSLHNSSPAAFTALSEGTVGPRFYVEDCDLDFSGDALDSRRGHVASGA